MPISVLDAFGCIESRARPREIKKHTERGLLDHVSLRCLSTLLSTIIFGALQILALLLSRLIKAIARFSIFNSSQNVFMVGYVDSLHHRPWEEVTSNMSKKAGEGTLKGKERSDFRRIKYLEQPSLYFLVGSLSDRS